MTSLGRAKWSVKEPCSFKIHPQSLNKIITPIHKAYPPICTSMLKVLYIMTWKSSLQEGFHLTGTFVFHVEAKNGARDVNSTWWWGAREASQQCYCRLSNTKINTLGILTHSNKVKTTIMATDWNKRQLMAEFVATSTFVWAGCGAAVATNRWTEKVRFLVLLCLLYHIDQLFFS